VRPRPNSVVDWRPTTVVAVLYALLWIVVGYDLVALLGPMLAAPTP
jgi:hypothetical protein